MKKYLLIGSILFLTLGMFVFASPQAFATVVQNSIRVSNLQPSWTATGGGGVYSVYYGPTAYAPVSPGSTAVYLGRQAAPIYAGVTPDPTYGDYEDQGLFAFKPGDVPVETFAVQPFTYDFVNQYGTAPVWVYIELNKGVAGDVMYQYVPTSSPSSYHTENAATGAHWQAWTDTDSGVTTGPMLSLADIASENPGKTVSRVYLTEGMGNSYHATPNGTVAWVDTATIGGTTYDFVTPDTTSPVITLNGDNPMTVAQGSVFVDPGATATDNVDGTDSVSILGTVDVSMVGMYTLTYTARDAAGNAATTVTRTVNVTDQTPPSVPALVSPTNRDTIKTNHFTFTWDASTDNQSGPITYEFKASLNPTEAAGVLTTGVWDSGILTDPSIVSNGASDGVWYWQVRAKDAIGNVSAWSDIWSATIKATPLTTSDLLKAADRLITLQNANGSWDWDVTNATGPTSYAYYNLAGVTGLGLVDAYTMSNNDSKYLDAAKKVGDYLVSFNSPSVNDTKGQNADSIRFLRKLATISGNTSYSTLADAILNHVLHEANYETTHDGNYCTTNGCTPAQLRASEDYYYGPDNQGAAIWDLEPFVTAARDSHDTVTATGIEAQMLDEISTYTPTTPYYTLAIASGISAANTVGDITGITTLLGKLSQNTDGSFGTLSEGRVQTTAYTLMALRSVGDSRANAAETYLKNSFGYSSINGWKETDGSEYAESDSEALHAIFNIQTSPKLEVAGFSADGAPMVGSVAGGFTLNTDNNAATNYQIQFTSGSIASESLKTEVVPLYLQPTAGQTAALQDYYTTKPAEYQTYLDAAAAGTQPFAYIKTNGTAIQILDGAQYTLSGGAVEKDMIVPGNYPLGSYTVSGVIQDLAGNTTTVTYALITAGDRTPPVLTIAGFMDGTNSMASQDGGYVLATKNVAAVNHEVQFSIGSNSTKALKDEVGLYLNKAGLDVANLTDYYTKRIPDGSDAASLAYRAYLISALDGVTKPFAYITTDASNNLVLHDAAQYDLAGNKTIGMVIPDNYPPGTYVVSGTAKDAAGNETSITLKLIVLGDRMAPVITMLGMSPITIAAGSVYADAGATALDDVDGTVTSKIEASNTVDTTKIGSYSVTYNVSDVAGNAAMSVVRVVNVTDQTAPVITIDGYNTAPTNTDITVSASTNEGTLNADSHTFTANGSFDFVATDAVGNVATSTVTITNIDKSIPTVSITSPTNGSVLNGIVAITADASDFGSGVARVEFYHSSITPTSIGVDTTAPYSISWDTSSVNSGSHTIYAKAYDNAGNSSGYASVGVTVASHVAAVTSGAYTVSAGGTANETIKNVPFETSKANFLAALTKGESDQTWNTEGISDPVVSDNTLVVTAQDGVAMTSYVVTVNSAPAPTLSSIAIANPAAKLSYIVGESLNISGLVIAGIYSDGSTTTEAITTGNISGFDSSTTTTNEVLTITVSGKTATYTIDVVAPKSSDNSITSFTIPTGDTTITETNIAITVPNGTNVTALVPTIVITGKSVSPASGVAQDFSSPITYVVTAEDGSMQTYTATVTVVQGSDATLSALTEDGNPISGFPSSTTTTYDVVLAAGTTAIPLVAATPTDANATTSITQASNLPGSATVSVTAQNGTTKKTYTIDFTVAPTPPTPTSTLNVSLAIDNSAGGTASASDFTINVIASNPSTSTFPGNSSGVAVMVDASKAYSVNVSSLDNYTAAFSNCADQSGIIANGSASCAITETYVAPAPAPSTITSGGSGGGYQGPSLGTGNGGSSGSSGLSGQTSGGGSDGSSGGAPQGQVLGASAFNFTRILFLGSQGSDVIELQNRLTQEGFYTGPITGYFGPLTEAAVKAYQAAHNLPMTGIVGPLTMAELNSVNGSVLGASTTGNQALQDQITVLQQQLLFLLQQLLGNLQSQGI